MDVYLNTEAWRQTAAKHSIRLGDPPANSVRTVALSELHDEAACLEYVSWLRDYIGAPDLAVAASMLAKRLGYLWTAPLATALTFHRQQVSLSPDGSFLYHPVILADEAVTRFPFLAVTEVRAEALPLHRAERRAEAVEELFARQLTPILTTLSRIAPLSMSILWENIMVRIGPLYKPNADHTEAERRQVQADFTYLTQEAPGALFDQRRNPFTRFTTLEGEVPAAKNERITCCFYYRMSEEYCKKCPKIDGENKSQLQ